MKSGQQPGQRTSPPWHTRLDGHVKNITSPAAHTEEA